MRLINQEKGVSGGRGVFGTIKKNLQRPWVTERSKLEHVHNAKHNRNVRNYQLYLENKKDANDLNKRACEGMLLNAAHCLLTGSSSVEFVRLNNADHLKGEIFKFLPANKNNSATLWFTYRDKLFFKISDRCKTKLRNKKSYSVTLDKVTLSGVSYTVVCTYFFDSGEIKVMMNKVHKMASDEYTGEETAEMLVKVLLETLGIDEEGKTKTVFRLKRFLFSHL